MDVRLLPRRFLSAIPILYFSCSRYNCLNYIYHSLTGAINADFCRKIFVSAALLVVALASFQSYAAVQPYEANTLQVVMTPDGFPVIWKNVKKYSVDFTLAGAPSADSTLSHCYAFDPTTKTYSGAYSCASPESSGAEYYKDYYVTGVGNVRVFYDGNGNIVGTQQTTQHMVAQGDFGSYAGTYIDNTSYTQSSDVEAVGTISGSFKVSPSGAATYDIPIVAPSGIAGMKPDIGLAYNSQAGNGQMGVGWSVTGLSTIARCKTTIATDGVSGGIDFNQAIFCLDGKRLIENSNDATEYRTEVESFTRVTWSGTKENPSQFIADTKSGLKYYYNPVFNGAHTRLWALSRIVDSLGNTITFQYEENPDPGTYYALETGNPGGNDYHISEIRYAYVNSTDYYAKIVFSYDYGRDDKFSGWVAGDKSTMRTRLRSIDTYSNNTLGREYRFKYSKDPESGVSLLSGIKLCAGTNECYRETSFDWLYANASIGTEYSSGLCSSGSGCDNKHIYYPDLNGDGLADVCYLSGSGITCFQGNGAGAFSGPYAQLVTCGTTDTSCRYTTSAQYTFTYDGRYSVQFKDVNGDGLADLVYRSLSGISYALSNGHGFQAFVNTGIFSVDIPDLSVSGSVTNESSMQYIYFPDVRGDGVPDLCFRGYTGIECHKSTGNSASLWDSVPYFKPADPANAVIPGLCQGGSNSWGGCDQADNFPTIRFVDLNGDGKDDLVYRSDSGLRAWFSTGSGFIYDPHAFDINQQYFSGATTVSLCMNEGNTTYSTCNQYDANTIRFADINGDGLPDLCYRDSSGISCWVNRGSADYTSIDATGYYNKLRWQGLIRTGYCADNSPDFGGCTSADNYNSIKFVDLNGDGKSDLVFRSNEGLQFFLSTGSGFNYYMDTDICGNGVTANGGCNDATNWNTISFADFNGDGRADLVYAGDSGIQGWINTDYKSNLITSITNGLGVIASVNYERLTNTAAYQKGAVDITQNYMTVPVRELQAPMHVVTTASHDDGIGGTSATSYSYAGLELNLQGRGLLGFKSVSSLDPRSVKTDITYEHDFPYIGMPWTITKSLTTAPNQNFITGNIISQVINYHDYVLSDGGRKYPYVINAHEVKRDPLELNSISIWMTETTTYTLMDSYGNVVERKVDVKDDTSANSLTYETDSNNRYFGDINAQIYGRLSDSWVTKTEPDGSSQTKYSSFDYYGNGLIKDEIIEPTQASTSNNYPIATQTTSYVYDNYGNVTTKTVSAPDVSPRTTTTVYDVSKRFAQTVTDALNHRIYREYDSVLGKVTMQLGPYAIDGSSPIVAPNAVKKTWGYDGFGREISSTVIDQTGAYPDVTTATQYSYCAVCDRYNVLYTVTSQTSGLPATISEYDMLGRNVLSVSTSLTGDQVDVETQYDSFGQVSKKSRPYFASPGAQSDDWTTFHYDGLGRLYQTDVPTKVGDVTTTAISTIDYNGLTTITTNSDNQVNKVIKDAIGRTVEVVDADNKSMTYAYTYVGNAEKKTTTDAQGNQIIVYLDARANKREMHDPDMGVWTYDYDGLNELVKQTDARGVITTMGYDDLGRLTTRTNFAPGSNAQLGYSTSVDTWVYDTLYPGQLTSESTSTISKTYQYDSMGRAKAVVTNMPSATYTVAKSYDAFGRPDVLTYPDGFAVHYVYQNGHLEKIVDNATSTLAYWKANYADAEGHITNIDYGNGINIIKGYTYGRLDFIDSGISGNTLQYDNYSYDAMGNMLSRSTLASDGVTQVPESFTYDNLNRLKTDTQAGITATYQYDELGNLLNKPQVISGASATSITYQYNATYKKRLDSTGGAVSQSFGYDANGSMISGGNRSYSWTTFNKLQSISNTTSFESYLYDASRTRARKYNNQGVTDYLMAGGNLGAQFESFKAYGSTAAVKKYFIYAGGGLVAVKKIDDTNATNTTEYMLTDNLGSVVMVTDENANVVDRRSYGPFGEARSTDWASVYGYTLTTQMVQEYKATTTRGYTGHEQMVDFGLVNMNGRIYDPVIGRFLSADSQVQDPTNMQSLNRYAYVMNNPLRYTDPSGHSIRSVLTAAAVIAVAYYSGVYIAPGFGGGAFTTAVVSGFAGGFTAGLLNGGGFDGAMTGGIFGAGSGMAFGTLHYYKAYNLQKIVFHGLAGGITSEMQGGGFKDGFLSAGFTQALSPEIWALSDERGARVFAAAIVGGTASVIGGGNFANGAISGAFSRLFNDENTDEGDGLSIDMKARLLKVLEVDYGLIGGKLRGAILVSDGPFSIKLKDDGSVIISQGESRVIVNGAHRISGAGAKWRNLSVDISMPKNGVIMISGTGSYHIPFIPGSFSTTVSESVDVRYALYHNSGLLGNADKAIVDGNNRNQRATCAMGFKDAC